VVAAVYAVPSRRILPPTSTSAAAGVVLRGVDARFGRQDDVDPRHRSSDSHGSRPLVRSSADAGFVQFLFFSFVSFIYGLILTDYCPAGL